MILPVPRLHSIRNNTARPVPKAGFPQSITTQTYLQRVLEAISEKRQYCLSLPFLFSLSKIHLSELKGNVASGVNTIPS